MNAQYKLLTSYLPFKCLHKKAVILHAYNKNGIILLYSFDKTKDIIFISDFEQLRYRYMSVYEFLKKDYRIILDEFELNRFIDFFNTLPL